MLEDDGDTSRYSVIGVTGQRLGVLPDEATNKITACIAAHSRDGATDASCLVQVERFSCSRGCTRSGMQGVGYKPLPAVWG